MIKRVISVFVLSLFLAHFAGFYIYFIFQVTKNRQEMRARLKDLPADQLQVLTLSLDEFEDAKEDDHELKVNGKMYDIARIERQGDFLLVYGLHDRAEDNILAFLDKILTSPLNDEHTTTNLLQFFALTYLPMYWNFSLPSPFEENFFTAYCEDQSSLYRELIVPPPKS